jgi:trimeric autotransporter adhesin
VCEAKRALQRFPLTSRPLLSATGPATDAEIAKARTTLPECASKCALGACRGKPAAEQVTCRNDCDTKQAACEAAVKTFVSDRIADSTTTLKMRLDEIRKTAAAITTVEEAKVRCKAFCTKNVEDANALTACKAVCDSITDVQSGLRFAANLMQAAARAKFEQMQATDPNAADKIKAAADKLEESVLLQRVFSGDVRAKIADALDARAAAIAQARATRQAAVQKAKDEIAAFKDKINAATTDAEKATIKADAKAQLEKAIAAAKEAQKARRAEIKADRKALIQKVLDAKKQRKANRQAIVADFKALVDTIADLKKAAQEVDPDAEVAPAAAGTKRQNVGAFVVMTCDQGDMFCTVAANNAIAGFTATETDVTVVTTTDADLNEADVEDPLAGDAVVGTTTTTASNISNSPPSSSVGDLESSSGGVEPWILGVIISGAVLAVVLVGLVVFCIMKRRRTEQPADKPAPELKQEYAAISVRPPDDYDQLHLKGTYDVVPGSRGDYVAGRVSAGYSEPHLKGTYDVVPDSRGDYVAGRVGE